MSLKIELNHNIILHMNYLILVRTRVPALINIGTIYLKMNVSFN